MTPLEACKIVADQPNAMASLLLFLALREARRYKWEKSIQEGKDAGSRSVVEWFKKNWKNWYRNYLVEHICGNKFWEEFGKEEFDLIHKNIIPNSTLMNQVISSVSKYGENLGIIQWALDNNHNLDQVNHILKVLDINKYRAELEEEIVIQLSDALDEADRYKWIESQKYGHDMGEKAILDWFKNNWAKWFHKIESSYDM